MRLYTLAVRYAPVVLLLALAAHLVAVAIWTKALTQLLDLGVYRSGGTAVIDRFPLYDRAMFEWLYFTYPPFAAIVFVPLALVPFGLLKLLFTAANVLALAGVIRLCLRSLGHRDGRVVVLLTGLLCWLEPVRSTIVVGQVNLLLMLLLMWDLTRPDGSRGKGIGVGLAAGIKLIPGIFVVYLLITRRFRAAALAATVFVGTIGLGYLIVPGDSARYWRSTFLATNRIGRVAEPGNQSLAGLLARLAAPAPHSTVLWLVTAVLLGAAGLAVAALAQRRGHELLGITCCGLTACVVSPFTWNHHWVWFVPAFVLLWHAAMAERRLWPLPAGLVLLVLDWPVALVTAPDRNTPSTGWIMLDAPSGLAPLTRNLYPLLAAVLVLLAVCSLRGSDPPGDPAPAGDLGEHDAGGHRGVE